MASTALNVQTEKKMNENEQCADENNNKSNKNHNDNKENNGNSMLTYELPVDYKYEVKECICDRPQKVFECGLCHHYFHGRIAITCKVHPNVIFLMDFFSCPYCRSPTEDAIESKLTWEQVRRIEDAQLPGDCDGL